MCAWLEKLFSIREFCLARRGGALGLSWHFLVDILGGGTVVIAALSIFLIDRLIDFSSSETPSSGFKVNSSSGLVHCYGAQSLAALKY